MPIAKEQIRQIISENNITSVADVYSLLRDSFKDILQELMEAEMDATLGYEKNQKGDLQSDNKRNGHSTKTLKSRYGEFRIDIPRDRNGEFEPKLVPKYQRDISGIEEKVISLYARGMSTRDIHDQLKDLYGVELSAEMKRQEQLYSKSGCSHLTPLAFTVSPENSHLIPEAGCGQSPRKRHTCKCLISHAKNSVRMYNQKELWLY